MNDAIELLHDYLTLTAARVPDKEALLCMKRRFTYRELNEQANALANALVARGIAPGDRVVVFADNTPETVIAYWGVQKANAIVSVVNPLTKADKLAYLLNDCGAAALISDKHLARVFTAAAAQSEHLKVTLVSGGYPAEKLAELPGGADLQQAIAEADGTTAPTKRRLELDLASIIYTSGSTGDPKGVMLTHRNQFAAANSVATYLGLREDDVILSALPLSFDYGLYQMIMSTRVGARLVLERSFTYPTKVLELIVAEQATVFPGVPTMFALMAEMKNIGEFDFSRVRMTTNTAAALHQKHIDALERVFPKAQIFSMYGLTECKRCTYLPPEEIDQKPGSVGIAIPGTEVWIVDEQGERVAAGVEGELVVRGPTVMKGYWQKPEATRERLKPGPLPGEFVLHTGDYCKQDEDGYVYFAGRRDDMIKSRGEKVAPKEVENALVAIDGVKESAVIGVPDDVLGSAIKGFVVLEAGVELNERQLQIACRQRLENFMVPKFIVIVDDLPKTTTGKIKKTDLK